MRKDYPRTCCMRGRRTAETSAGPSHKLRWLVRRTWSTWQHLQLAISPRLPPSRRQLIDSQTIELLGDFARPQHTRQEVVRCFRTLCEVDLSLERALTLWMVVGGFLPLASACPSSCCSEEIAFSSSCQSEGIKTGFAVAW